MAKPQQLPLVAISHDAHDALKATNRETGVVMTRLASDAIIFYLATHREALRNGGKVPKGKGRTK